MRSFTDLKIFRLKLKLMLATNEYVIADRRYKDTKCIFISSNMIHEDRLFSICRARHEIVNRRLKQFNEIGQGFRHNLSLHSLCFHDAANNTQLILENDSPLLEIQ